MRGKTKNKRGFTLAELLIVVAIIAVLVAIMIPVFGSSREKAILEKDAANMRSVYAEKVVEAMTEDSYLGGTLTIDIDKTDDFGGKFDSTPSVASGAGGDITVTHGSFSETIDVDNNVTVTLTNFS